jgi:tetratricopeptide (TPR) repeat protein
MSLLKLQQAAEFFKINDLVQAERLYSETITKHPECGQAYLGMGTIALKIEQFDKAVYFLTKSCELLPNEAIPLIRLSTAFNGVYSEIDALTALKYAKKNFPNDVYVHYHLGLQFIMFGYLDNAKQSFETVIQLTQTSITSFALLELTRVVINPEQYLTLLETRLKQKKLVPNEATVLHYALGNVLDSMQHYDQAWRHFENANLLQAELCEFKTIELQSFFEQIKTIASVNVLSKRRSPDKDTELADTIPIFIVGLPRTGSTLLEQLLIEHQDIATAGEVPYLSRDVADYLFSHSKSHYPYSMASATQQQLDVAAQIYLKKISLHAKGKRYVIDKLPANFQSIGLIYQLFPNAKIIHLKRDLPDVAFSIYRNFFAQNEPYLCSLSEFKQYHNFYQDLMEHWNTQLPGFIHEVSYEKLVEDKIQSIKGILEFCELPSRTHGSKLPEANKVIKTLSNVQVRRPMSTTVINNCYNYAKYLNQFIEDKQVG